MSERAVPGVRKGQERRSGTHCVAMGVMLASSGD